MKVQIKIENTPKSVQKAEDKLYLSSKIYLLLSFVGMN